MKKKILALLIFSLLHFTMNAQIEVITEMINFSKYSRSKTDIQEFIKKNIVTSCYIKTDTEYTPYNFITSVMNGYFVTGFTIKPPSFNEIKPIIIADKGFSITFTKKGFHDKILCFDFKDNKIVSILSKSERDWFQKKKKWEENMEEYEEKIRLLKIEHEKEIKEWKEKYEKEKIEKEKYEKEVKHLKQLLLTEEIKEINNKVNKSISLINNNFIHTIIDDENKNVKEAKDFFKKSFKKENVSVPSLKEILVENKSDTDKSYISYLKNNKEEEDKIEIINSRWSNAIGFLKTYKKINESYTAYMIKDIDALSLISEDILSTTDKDKIKKNNFLFDGVFLSDGNFPYLKVFHTKQKIFKEIKFYRDAFITKNKLLTEEIFLYNNKEFKLPDILGNIKNTNFKIDADLEIKLKDGNNEIINSDTDFSKFSFDEVEDILYKIKNNEFSLKKIKISKK